jgi:hypothetical protein
MAGLHSTNPSYAGHLFTQGVKALEYRWFNIGPRIVVCVPGNVLDILEAWAARALTTKEPLLDSGRVRNRELSFFSSFRSRLFLASACRMCRGTRAGFTSRLLGAQTRTQLRAQRSCPICLESARLAVRHYMGMRTQKRQRRHENRAAVSWPSLRSKKAMKHELKIGWQIFPIWP